MIVRSFEDSDIQRIKELHQKHYNDDYLFDKLFENLLGTFIIEEGSDIVCAGGVKTIAEAILVTNKDLNIHTKLKGLNEALQVNEFITRRAGFNQLHAFLQDDVVWRAWLKKVGFKKCNGTPYYLGV